SGAGNVARAARGRGIRPQRRCRRIRRQGATRTRRAHRRGHAAHGMTSPGVRILIVDDSATARAALGLALTQAPGFSIVGEAKDAATAVRLVEERAPDLVTMDVFLRAENGFDVARSILSARPTPIVAVTAADHHDPSIVFRAMEAGVLDVSTKLPAPSHPDY